MGEYLINLGISILGSAIVMFVAYFWKFRILFKKTTFINQESAEKNIIEDIKKSKNLRVFAMCASTFSDTRYSEIAKIVLNNSGLKQSYLISDDRNENIERRQKELPANGSNLKTKVQNSINNFKAAKEINKNIEYRLHNKIVGWRIIILDHCCYISPQQKDKYGKDAEMQRKSSSDSDYIHYSDYFDDLWKQFAPRT